jgi:HPt (histidine-containing phosphotransfer) domain-containing protein
MHATDNDEAMTRELIDLFVSSGDESLAAIADAAGRGDCATIKHQAHSLKGASANLHATGANRAAAILESAARQGSVDELVRLSDELRAEMKRAVDYMRARIAG